MKTLHLASVGPITKNFFSFLEKNLDCSGDELISMSDVSAWPTLEFIKNISSPHKLRWLMNFWVHANKADKIILHGLWGLPTVLALALNPWLLKRCYWIIWGGDLYYHRHRIKNYKSNIAEILRRFVIRRFGHIVSYVEGDVELARQWYGARGVYHECILYTSNIYREHKFPEKLNSNIAIQVGNSADPSNNHIEILDRLMPFSAQDILIYAPLSYGDREHARLVQREGAKRFGKKFIALTELMPIDEYLKFLEAIDIAIFNHRRQQAMGNTITLLGMGKKVYLNSEVTPWATFRKIGVKIHDSKELSLENMSPDVRNSNMAAIKDNFSAEKLIEQWGAMLKG